MSPCCMALLAAAWAAADVPEVTVSKPVSVPGHVDLAGHLEPSAHVELRPRVAGILARIHARPGADVQQGAVLFEIDDRTQKAELAQAQAEVAVAEANGKAMDAELRRARRLLENMAISREEVDKIIQQHAAADAAVKAARARVDRARLAVEQTRVLAPIAGRLGRLQVDVGSLVAPDRTVLASLVRIDPLFVDFDVDERTALALQPLLREGHNPEVVSFRLADEVGHPHKAKLESADNRIDPKTGTLRVRAVTANADGKLLPGLFVRVRLELGKPKATLLVQPTAVVAVGDAHKLLVVNDDDVLEERTVKVGIGKGGMTGIEDGLKGDEWVVVDRKALKAGDKVKRVRRLVPPQR